MNGTHVEQAGCEAYLYREIQCCLHACSATKCPEPVCAMDFPGGIHSYLRYKSLQTALRSGMDIQQAAVFLNISKDVAYSLFNKGAKVLVKVRKTHEICR